MWVKKGNSLLWTEWLLPIHDDTLSVRLSTRTCQHCTVFYRFNCIDFTLEVTVQLINMNKYFHYKQLILSVELIIPRFIFSVFLDSFSLHFFLSCSHLSLM